MKKFSLGLLGLSVVTSLLSGSALAQAVASDNQTGSVRFDGRVIDQTCEVMVGSANNQQTVDLPWVTMEQLKNNGDVAGKTAFKITFTGCKYPSSGEESVHAGFILDSNVDSKTGNLLNIAQNGSTPSENAATNVQIQLSGSEGKVIKINEPFNTDTNTGVDLPTTGTPGDVINDALVASYGASYVAVGGSATPGKVQALVNYNIVYK